MLTLEQIRESDPNKVYTVLKKKGRVQAHPGLPTREELSPSFVEMDPCVRAVVEATRGDHKVPLICFEPIPSGPADGKSGWHELPGGKLEGREIEAALKAELEEEVGSGAIGEKKELGHIVEIRFPETDPQKPHYVADLLARPVRVKVSVGFKVFLEVDLSRVAAPFAVTELQRPDFRPSRILVPSLAEAHARLTPRSCKKTRLLRDCLYAQWALNGGDVAAK